MFSNAERKAREASGGELFGWIFRFRRSRLAGGYYLD
jgi:hypothetical protein